MATLGEKLRDRRKSHRLTLDELADRVGSSKSYLWELENRASARPSAEKLAAIARELSVPVEYFLDDAGVEPAQAQLDDVFFRKYKSLSSPDKAQLNAIIDTFRKKKT
jgi:transcriptional regulator with XRE-family HTH domain